MGGEYPAVTTPQALKTCASKKTRLARASLADIPSQCIDRSLRKLPGLPYLEVEFQEREGKRPWITHRIKKGTFFLTSGGAPYDCRWKAVTSDPFGTMAVFIELPLLQRSLEEILGHDAAHARLRDISAFTDVALNSWMERLRDELMRRHASPLFLQGIAQAIAIHLARKYAETTKELLGGSPSLLQASTNNGLDGGKRRRGIQP
jgi:hypothetical protein